MKVVIHRGEELDHTLIPNDAYRVRIGDFVQEHGQGIDAEYGEWSPNAARDFCLQQLQKYLQSRRERIDVDLTIESCQDHSADITDQDVKTFIVMAKAYGYKVAIVT